MSLLPEPLCHELFPLAVYENKVLCHSKIKEQILKNFEHEKFPTRLEEQFELPDGRKGVRFSESHTGEFLNKTRLHLNPDYRIFFSELRHHCDRYLSILGLDFSKVKYYVTKSWLVLHDRPEQVMSNHVHPDSNISFVHYISCPKGAQNFSVFNSSRQNELSPDCFFKSIDDSTRHYQIVSSFNKFNEEERQIKSTEGNIILFPGWKTLHSTSKSNELPQGDCLRIAISGDIKVVLKPDYAGSVTFSSPPEEWLSVCE